MISGNGALEGKAAFAGLMLASLLAIGLAIGLYDLDVVTRREEVLRRAALASVLAPLATLGLFYAVFYAPIGEPEWTGKGKPDTSEEASLSVFWKAVKRWTDGPRMCVGMDADGFKTYTKES